LANQLQETAHRKDVFAEYVSFQCIRFSGVNLSCCALPWTSAGVYVVAPPPDGHGRGVSGGGSRRTPFMIGAGAFFLIRIVDLVGSRFHQPAVAK